MRKAKWRIEYTSPFGQKISIVLEGDFDFIKVKQLMDLIEILSSEQFQTTLNRETFTFDHDYSRSIENRRSLKKKLINLLSKRFKDCWFTSKEVAEAYYEEYGEFIPVNVVATYLARFHYSGMLVRRGSRAQWRYKISTEMMPKIY